MLEWTSVFVDSRCSMDSCQLRDGIGVRVQLGASLTLRTRLRKCEIGQFVCVG